jgi:outer membrane protein
MKRLLYLCPLVAVMLVLGILGIASAQGVKIGMIDTQKILRESKAAKEARDIWMKELETRRAKYKAEEEEARKLEEEIKTDGQNMPPEIRKEKTEKLEKEFKELGRLKSDLEQELRKKDLDLSQSLIKDVYEIVRDLSKKEKFTVILDKRFVFMSDEAIDLTDRVIRLYDAMK